MDNDSISVRFTDIDEPIKSRNLLSLSNSHRTGSILKKIQIHPLELPHHY